MNRITFQFYPYAKQKALTMSYDDGQVYDRRLIEIFNRYGIRGTFHLISGLLDHSGYVTSAEVSQLYGGHEVAGHTRLHNPMSMLPDGGVLQELLEDKRALETLCGIPLSGMSYPYGDCMEGWTAVLPKLGIRYARTVQSTGRFSLPQNFLLWNPTCHHTDRLMERLQAFQHTNPWDWMPLLYVWGAQF